jgi:hypothetical protein
VQRPCGRSICQCACRPTLRSSPALVSTASCAAHARRRQGGAARVTPPARLPHLSRPRVGDEEQEEGGSNAQSTPCIPSHTFRQFKPRTVAVVGGSIAPISGVPASQAQLA